MEAIRVFDVCLDGGDPSRGRCVWRHYISPDVQWAEVADATRFLAVRGSLVETINNEHMI